MTTVAVTGAAGSVGRRVVEQLAAEPGIRAIRAFDRITLVSGAEVDFRQVDIAQSDSEDLFTGCDTVIHLADDQRRRHDPTAAVAMLGQILAQAERAGCSHVVVVSSALVYGAYRANPVPLTEHHERRPNPGLAYAVGKARLEHQAETWARRTGVELAILRPTATLSERGTSYIAGALRAATSLRSEPIEVPVQFLHHDDLASAVTLVAVKGMASIYNVAPDGWIGPDVFRDLLAEAELRWPEPVDEVVGRLAGAVRQRRLEAGIAPYTVHPWVIANDRLRAAGWDPTYSNEEAFVLGTPTPWWRAYSNRRRQELALGAVGVAAAGTVAGAGLLARWLLRQR
jgi:UDP-glucose 4-epimerase